MQTHDDNDYIFSALRCNFRSKTILIDGRGSSISSDNIIISIPLSLIIAVKSLRYVGVLPYSNVRQYFHSNEINLARKPSHRFIHPGEKVIKWDENDGVFLTHNSRIKV